MTDTQVNVGEQSERQTARRRDAAIGYLAQVAAACIVMMWSVMNVVHNFWAIKGSGKVNEGEAAGAEVVPGDWNIAIGMAIVLGVIPFLLSLFWLYRIINKTK